MKKTTVLSAFLAGALVAQPASACDICSVYTLLGASESDLGVYAGLFEQYSDFGTLRLDGDEVPNEEDQSLRSSISQVILGYQFNRRFGVQANVPLIDRSYERPGQEGEGMERGSESGLGDVSVVALWRALERIEGESVRAVSLIAGVKLPSGDSDRLAEELAEGHHDEGEEQAGEHAHAAPVTSLRGAHEGEHHAASGVHGHDLALGSGSTDYLVGGSAFLSWKRLATRASAQYAIRTEGDFDYRYANDATWNVEAGVFALLSHERSLRVGVGVSGEKKGEDELRGEPLPDTAIEAIYAGPAISYSRGEDLFAELNLDLPVEQETSDLQIVPDWRARFAFSYRF